MTRYYFHLWNGRDHEIDDIGIELPSAESACLEAFHGVRSMLLDLVREGRDTTGYRFDIFDDQNRLLHEISFAEALGQRVTLKKPVQSDCVELVNRGYALAADLAREISLVQENLRASRKLIADGEANAKASRGQVT